MLRCKIQLGHRIKITGHTKLRSVPQNFVTERLHDHQQSTEVQKAKEWQKMCILTVSKSGLLS